MSDLAGTPGELRCTVTITRKATGAVETYEMVGRVTAQPEEEQKPNPTGDEDVSNA